MKGLRGAVLAYAGFLAAVLGGAMALSYTGAAFPGPDDKSKVSLRDESVRSRRAHYYGSYLHGK